MREKIAAYLDSLINLLLIGAVSFTSLIFAHLTTEYFETPKLIFLASLVLVMLLIWNLSWVLKGKVSITRTPLDLPLLALLFIVILSTVFTVSKSNAIFGNFPKVHGSTISWVVYILTFFIAASHISSLRQIKTLIFFMLFSSTLTAFLALLSFFHIYLFPFANYPNFSPAGSSFSTLSPLILLLPFTLSFSLRPNTYLPQIVAAALTSIFGVTILLLGTPLLYVVALLTYVLSLYFNSRAISLKESGLFLVIPAVLTLVVATFAYSPFKTGFNLIGQKMISFPREIQLPFSTSWKVSVSAFRDSPLLGSGPSTYLFDFSSYKPIEHLATRFWNVRFDSAFNELLQVLATLGILGLLAFIFLCAVIINFSWKAAQVNNQDWDEVDTSLKKSLGVSGLVIVILFALHSTSLVSLTISLFILSMLMATNKSVRGKVQELTIGIKASSLSGESTLVTGDALPTIILIPAVILIIYAFWNMAFLVQADYYHRLALNSASSQGIQTYNYLVAAEKLNPRIDLYRSDLAQTNFALANAIATSKGPTQSSPSGSLTDQDKRTIQQLLTQAINEARAAVTLSPRNRQNWEILASIYRQISGVAQNAFQFSLNAYGRAIQLDPLDPQLRLSVGGLYYSVKNYDLAIRFFSDAVNLKPDFANGFYNLSIALRDRGDLQQAQAAAEKVVSLIDPKNPDYKIASNYLADLKSRIATGSANQSQITPPAAQETSSLQKKQLPKVLELPEPERVATPEAVKKNPKAELQVNSSPSPTP